MVFINADGTVVEKRSIWRLSIFSDFFWGVINIISIFFESMFKSKNDTVYRNKRRKNVRGFGNDDDNNNSRRPPKPRPKGRRGFSDMGDLKKRAATCNTPVGGGGG